MFIEKSPKKQAYESERKEYWAATVESELDATDEF